MSRMTSLPDGTSIPVLGQGTWEIGGDPRAADAEQAALSRGLDLGLTLIDTAELYGNGKSERLVGEVIKGRRDEVFLVSKVKPENAGEMSMMLACERSLERLGVDRLDLYLLHWESRHPMEEIIAGFEELAASPLGPIVGFGLTVVLFSFLLNGARHLINDTGRALTLKPADLLSSIAVYAPIPLAILFWVALFATGRVSL